MSARRSKRNTKSSKSRLHRGINLIEGLENRTLFNTVITDTDPLTSTPATVSFEYKDARDNNVRVTVHGDVSAEFLFARINKDGTRLIRDSVGTTSFDDDGKLQANDEDGRDLYHVYIAQASIDSYISIAAVPAFDDEERPMDPFGGSSAIQIQPARGTVRPRTVGPGAVYLGARTRGDVPPAAAQNIPIRTLSFNGWGIMPANSKGTLVAGISTAPSVSIGKFMLGGTVSGNVRFEGSVETFYCGSLLTGVTEGQGASTPLAPNNFYVGGDIRNILVASAVGTDGLPGGDTRDQPSYLTGVDFDIKGRVGQIRTGGGYPAFGTIENNLPGLGLRTRQQEIEFRIDATLNRGDFTEFENGQFGDAFGFFNNDSFETAQFLGSINSKQLGQNTVQLNGLLQWSSEQLNDGVDYYAVPLMAGQQITVRLLAAIPLSQPTVINGQLVSEIPSDLHVGVFDPEQRLIASDYSTKIATTTLPIDSDPNHQQVFSFTAEKPGIYRIAVGLNGPDFSTDAGPFIGEQTYQLQMTGIGNLGLGGLVADGTILALPGDAPAQDNSITGALANIEVIHGDLGAIYTTDYIMASFGINGIADGGDFRAFDAQSLGIFRNGRHSSSADLVSLTGSVGMIRSSGTNLTGQTTQFNRGAGAGFVIGGDIQYFISNNTIVSNIECNGSIGVIRTERYGASNFSGFVSANVDGIGKPGTIDLIDVNGDLGTLQAGGPTISVNRGGNVRYIHIPAGATAYRPLIFGGSQPEQTTYVRGQEAQITDDSGGQVTLAPTKEITFDSITLLPIDLSGTLTVLTYPIARSATNTGGGGVVIIRVESTRGVGVKTTGGSVEIGDILSRGSGPSLVTDRGPDGVANTGDENFGPDGIPNTGDEPFTLDPSSTADNSIDMRGALTDVYMLRGGNFNYVRNRTGGEIANAQIGQVGLLEGSNLGIAKSSIRPGMVTEGVNVIDNPGTSETEGALFPFLNAKNGISINGGGNTSPAVVEIDATQAIGNLMILGIAQDINANSDNVGVKGVYEGINGAVYAKGTIRNIMIGEGVLPSGTGNYSRAGIFCIGEIEKVTNQGLNSDIRGDIVSDTGIGKIELNNGSIINCDINVRTNATPNGTGADLAPSREFGEVGQIIQGSNIDEIELNGIGGIIGANVVANNIGPVNVNGGFGVINTIFGLLGDGRFARTATDGFGYRGAIYRGGQSLESITARGDGSRLKTTAYAAGVRLSETLPFDPFFGTKPNAVTDLHVVLGTTKASPSRKGTSASGSIDISTIRVSRDLGAVSANTIRYAELNIGNNIGSIVTGSYTDSLQVTAGRIDTLHIGRDALRNSFEISGPVGNVYVGGSFKGTSSLAASGPNGTIANFVTDNTLYGAVSAEKSIGTIRVGTYYGSIGTHSGGNINKFVVGLDFNSGAILDVNKTLVNFIVGRDFQDGALVKAGVLGTTTIIGANTGDFEIG